MKIRDRIKELRRVKASELYASPRNWRAHPQAQQDALRGVLAEVGYADALLARELPDGHLRAETTPDQEVPVLVLDVDQDEANKLLTVLDPMAAMAEANNDALGRLIHDLHTDSDPLRAMVDDLAAEHGIDPFADGGEEVDPDAEWKGMPQFEQEDTSGIRAIVHFQTEEDQRLFEKLVGQSIPPNTHSIWYPKKEREDLASREYAQQS